MCCGIAFLIPPFKYFLIRIYYEIILQPPPPPKILVFQLVNLADKWRETRCSEKVDKIYGVP